MTSQPLQPFRRITVSVRRADWPAWLGLTTGVVRVDGRRVAFLFGGKTRQLHVTPGEHTIGVAFCRDYVETQPLRLEEGDRIDLVCGRRKPWLTGKTLMKTALLVLGWAVVEFVIRPKLPEIRESLVSIQLGLNLGVPGQGALSQLLRSLPGAGAILPLLLVSWSLLVLRWGRESNPCYLSRSLSKKKPFAGDL